MKTCKQLILRQEIYVSHSFEVGALITRITYQNWSTIWTTYMSEVTVWMITLVFIDVHIIHDFYFS